MAGPIGFGDCVIILRARVDILDDKCDRCTERDFFAVLINERTGQDFHGIRLATLCYELALSRTATVEILLNLRGGEWNSRRATVDNAADCNPVTFAKGRDPEHQPEGIERHRSRLACSTCRRLYGWRRRGSNRVALTFAKRLFRSSDAPPIS